MRPARSSTFYLILASGPALLALGAIARILPRGLRPVCLTHAFTGLPCPGCGSFRALSLFVSGDFSQAFFMQPLMTLLFSATFLVSAAAAALWLLRLPTPESPKLPQKGRILLIGSAALIMLLNWLYLVFAGI